MEYCENCRFWSELVAESIGTTGTQAMCLSKDGRYSGKMTRGHNSCPCWKQLLPWIGSIDMPDAEADYITADNDAELAEIVDAIFRERRYQDKKWGDIDKNPHTIFEWIGIMEKELQEAKEAYFQPQPYAREDMLREILQAVAVGMACLEQHGFVERKEND